MVLLLLFFDRSILALLPLAAAFCHEAGHLMAMRRYKLPIREIEMTLFGADIKSAPKPIGALQTAVIYFAGPLFNLLAAGVIGLLFPRSCESEFFIVNSLALAFLNLLPIRTLDGGCIVAVLLDTWLPKHAARASDILSASALLLLWLLSAYILLLCGGNISLLLFCLYLFAELYLREAKKTHKKAPYEKLS